MGPAPNTLTLTLSSADNILLDDTQHSVTAVLRDTRGNIIPNYPIQIKVTGASGTQTFNGTTNSSGEYSITYSNSGGVVGTDYITATVTYQVPTGMMFWDGTHQKIVLAGDPQTGSVQGYATKTWSRIPTHTPTSTPTETPTSTPTWTPTNTSTATPTQTAQPLPAFCQQLGASTREAILGQTIYFEGRAQNGTQGYAITAYKFIFGDGSETAWVSVIPLVGPFVAGSSHAYQITGRYQVQFLVRLANGQVVGGVHTRCALVVTITPPPPPEPICVERPPLFIVGVVEQCHRLALTGLSWDYAPIEVQIQGPNDADFVTKWFH